MAFFALGSVTVLLIYAVFAPWAFFLGGRFHPLAYWHGWGRLQASAAGEYVVFVQMWPTPGGRTGRPSVTGSAELCTPRGEHFSLRLGGGMMNKHVGLDSDGQPMHLYMYRRSWLSGSFNTERRPRLELQGRWRNPDLVMDDRGSLSRAFLPDGRLYLGPPSRQPAARETLPVTLRSGSRSDFELACEASRR